MEVVSSLYPKPFLCKLGLKCDFQNWVFLSTSNNLSCKNTLPTQKLFLCYKKRQSYSFPRFRRTLLKLSANQLGFDACPTNLIQLFVGIFFFVSFSYFSFSSLYWFLLRRGQQILAIEMNSVNKIKHCQQICVN